MVKVYALCQVNISSIVVGTLFNFVLNFPVNDEIFASGTKIVKHFQRGLYDPGIIEKTIGLVLGPSTAMYRLFLKH